MIMKKCVVKILLLVLVAATLLSALSVSAFADGNTVEYTLKAGDTVIGVCQTLGLNYAQCKAAIMKLNGIGNEDGFRFLKAGQKLKFPASNADAALIVAPTTTTTPTPTPTPTTPATPSTPTTTASTIDYVLKAGDAVAAVCTGKGLDFAKCKAAIMKLNNIASENDFRYLKAGRTIKLPATNADAAIIAANGATTPTTPATPSTPVINSGNSAALKEGDFVAYYLAPHVMQAGETIYTVCIAEGVNFTENEALIKGVNNIKNYNRIFVGKSILLPVKTAPTTGSFYKVVGHKMVAGDTVYNLCIAYGLNYNNIEATLKTLNNKTNLARINAGSTLYLPIPATAAAGGNGGAGGTTGGTTGGVTSKTPYNIVINATKNGTVAANVNGANAATALAGSTVNIVTTPAEGYAVKSVTVTYADGSAKLDVTSGKFVMPECGVSIDVSFDKGYSFVKKTENGSFTLESNGLSVTSVTAGAKVKVNPSPNAGYALKDIQVTYKGNPCATVDSDNCFIMPAHDVTVTVNYKAVDTYKINASAVVNGSYSVTVKNGTVKEVAEGVKVTVKTTPNTGYTLNKIKVLDSASNEITVSNGVFTMPASDVTISVTFRKIPTYEITDSTAQSNGSYKLTVDGTEVTKAEEGKTVKVSNIVPKEGYRLKSVRAFGSIELEVTEENTFKMPAEAVKVFVEFELIPLYDIVDSTSQVNGTYSINFNGAAVTKAEEGKTIQVVATPAEGYKLKHIRAFTTNGELTVTDGCFTMPALQVKVFVEFEKKA